MRLDLLNPTYWPEVRRGTERVVHDLAEGLTREGHAVRVLTSHRGPPARRHEDGFEVLRSYRPPAWRLGWRQRHLTHVPFTYAALRHRPPDVATAFYVTDALAAARWTRAFGRPSVFSIMGVPEPGALRHRLQGRVWRRALDGATVLTVLSRAALEGLRSTWDRDDAVVIPPGVDLGRFSPGSEREPRPTVLCPAAIDPPRKRIALLVEAFRLLRRDVPEARLWLYGPSTPRGARAAGLPAEGIVSRGEVGPGELAAAYRRAWVTVLPSVQEAFGLVLVESLACGTPVVGTDADGIAEIVAGDDRIGALFAGDDPAELAVALRAGLQLAQAPGTREACRTRAAGFSTEAMVSAYERLYRGLA